MHCFILLLFFDLYHYMDKIHFRATCLIILLVFLNDILVSLYLIVVSLQSYDSWVQPAGGRKFRRWGNKKYWSCNTCLVRVSLHSRSLSTLRPKSTEADALPFGVLLTPSFCPRYVTFTMLPGNVRLAEQSPPVGRRWILYSRKSRLRAAEMCRWNVERWSEFLKKLIFPSKRFHTLDSRRQTLASSLRAFPRFVREKANIYINASVSHLGIFESRQTFVPCIF